MAPFEVALIQNVILTITILFTVNPAMALNVQVFNPFLEYLVKAIEAESTAVRTDSNYQIAPTAIQCIRALTALPAETSDVASFITAKTLNQSGPSVFKLIHRISSIHVGKEALLVESFKLALEWCSLPSKGKS